ncbi:MAG: hypothetical protein Q4B87_01250, partial [Candidatus Saccharibacteria bacterium]|nr:hypothetical protein [Candidatus Saccharibacteria bacterium]
ESDNYTIALGANIDYTKSAGTYTNTFILTAVANNVAYTINYKDNTSDSSVSNLPSTESASEATASSFTLSSTVPTRTGYTFNEWCDGTVTHNATGNDTCSGNTYSAGSTYSFASPSSTSTNVANLYAMWNVKTYSLAITFAGSGVSSVQVRTDSGTGGTLMGTVSSSGGSVSGLTYGVAYYLYPTYSTGYTLNSWSKTDSAAGSVLSSTTSTNPTYKIGAGNGAVTITGKSSGPIVIIKNVANMTKVSLNGTECTSTSGCTITGLTNGRSYQLKAYYTTTSRRFTGWTVSGNGTVATAANAETTFTPTSGTITITPNITTSCTAISPITGYMQGFSFTSSHCDSGSLLDRRDNQIYTVARLNGGWWMTRNLAIGCNGSSSTYGSSVSSKYLTSSYSNVSSGWYTPTNLLSAASSSTQTADYSNPRMQCDSTYGAWYNYAAASAGTITTNSNSTADTHNICPAGWTLPTESQFSRITSYSSAFSPVDGGVYLYGSKATNVGSWWSATANNTTNRYGLLWNSSLYTANVDRVLGYYVRCILQQQQTGGTCFTAGSQVQVSLDGLTKNIEDVRIGDEVVSYDPDQKEYYMTEVLDTIVHDGVERSTHLVELTLDDNTQLNMTKNHPILTKEGYKAISEANYPELTSSDIVITTSGERSIRSIRIYDTEPTVVYNLTVRGRDAENGPTHSYIVNGVVVHNISSN